MKYRASTFKLNRGRHEVIHTLAGYWLVCVVFVVVLTSYVGISNGSFVLARPSTAMGFGRVLREEFTHGIRSNKPKSHHSRTNHHPSRDQQRHYNSDSQLIYSKCASSVDVYSSISNFSVPTRLNTVTDENGILLHLLDLDDLNPEGSLDETYTIVVTNNEAPRHNRSTAHVPPHCRELDRQADHTVCRFVDHRVPIEPLRQELVSDSPRVMYEMHIETFSPDGTFDGAISKLPYLVALGITCIEIMPVNEGIGGWGYGQKHIFAISGNLGGYDALRRLVNSAHKLGLEVILDVVYNHADANNLFLGLDGCELNTNVTGLKKTFCPTNNFTRKTECDFGSYFYLDERQLTQWGPRYKFSSEAVSTFLLDNIRYWIEEVGFDGLRFDSTGCTRKTGGANLDCAQEDAIDDPYGVEFLRKSTHYLSRMGKLSIAEDFVLMNTKEFVTKDRGRGRGRGLGFDAQWDDSLFFGFEYALMAFADESMHVPDPLSRLRESLQYQCVIADGKRINYIENHDLSSRHTRSSLRVRDYVMAHGLDVQVAQLLPLAVSLTSCGMPMLFQGQEVGEMRLFDTDQPPKVRWKGVDPRFSDTGDICYLPEDPHWKLFSLTRRLIHVYKSLPALQSNDFIALEIPSPILGFRRGSGDNAVLVILNFGVKPFMINNLEAPLPGTWTAVFDSSTPIGEKAQKYHGGGSGNNLLTFAVSAMATLILHPGETTILEENFKANCVLKPLIPVWGVLLVFLAWILAPALIFAAIHGLGSKDLARCSSSSCTLENGSIVYASQATCDRTEEEVSLSKQTIRAMICSLEHSLPKTICTDAISQKCGGLGKVIEIASQYHPGPVVLVTPMMGNATYPCMREANPIQAYVNGREEYVQIYHYIHQPTSHPHPVEFIFVKHSLFGCRISKDDDLYPNEGEDLSFFLEFYSLWNQTVCGLAIRHKRELDVLHLTDYHTALAPLMIKKRNVFIPVLCTLHNASYQGHLEINLDERLVGKLCKAFCLTKEDILAHCVLDGQFNMLSCLVNHIHREQNGHGICAVSNQYANEVALFHSCLRSMRASGSVIGALPNPELLANRPKALAGINCIEDLRDLKTEKKTELQKALGLKADSTAIIGAFVGRLVAQKGVDCIADAASKLLTLHPDLQLIVVGPIGDIFGRYAATKMTSISKNPLFAERVFFKPEFFRFTADMKLGCDFAIMPSRTEPFGFVDIEFAWCGCPTVGSLVGGLGKTPGWYYSIWEGGDFNYLADQLAATVSKAISEGRDEILNLGFEGIKISFPVLHWQESLLNCYQRILTKTQKPSRDHSGGELWEQSSTRSVWTVRGSGELSSDSRRIRRGSNTIVMIVSELLTKGKSLSMRELLHQSSKMSTSTSMTGSLSSSSSSNSLDFIGEHGGAESNTPFLSSDEQQDIALNRMTLKQFMAVEVCHRSIESWLVVILSIITPNFSILLYVKSLQWIHEFGWDESIMSSIYFTQTICFGAGSTLWVFVMQRVTLSRCVFGAGLLYTVQCLALLLLPVDERSEAVKLSALTGFASSASGVMYMACMFFEDVESSLSLMIKKFGWVEGLRTTLSGLILGALIRSPLHTNSSNTMTLCIYSLLLMATFGISLVLLFGAQSKMKTTKMPKIQLSTFLHLRSYPWLAASQLVEAFIGYNAVFIVAWLILDGFTKEATAFWLQYSAVFSGVLLFAFSRIIAPLQSTPKCFTMMTTALVNPTILMALLMIASPTMTTPLLLICMTVIVFLMQLKKGMIGIWMLQVNSSRWRIVTYHGVELFVTNLVSAASPFIMRSMAKAVSFSTDIYDYSNAASAAQAILFISLPFIIISICLQVLANKHYYEDACDIYTKNTLIKQPGNQKGLVTKYLRPDVNNLQQSWLDFFSSTKEPTRTNPIKSTLTAPLLSSVVTVRQGHEDDSPSLFNMSCSDVSRIR